MSSPFDLGSEPEIEVVTPDQMQQFFAQLSQLLRYFFYPTLGPYTWDFQTLTPGNVATKVAPQNARRAILWIGIGNGANVSVGPDNTVTTTKQLQLVNGQVPFVLTKYTHGPLVQQEWWAILPAAGNTCTVFQAYDIEGRP